MLKPLSWENNSFTKNVKVPRSWKLIYMNADLSKNNSCGFYPSPLFVCLILLLYLYFYTASHAMLHDFLHPYSISCIHFLISCILHIPTGILTFPPRFPSFPPPFPPRFPAFSSLPPWFPAFPYHSPSCLHSNSHSPVDHSFCSLITHSGFYR